VTSFLQFLPCLWSFDAHERDGHVMQFAILSLAAFDNANLKHRNAAIAYVTCTIEKEHSDALDLH